ncbi:MAG: hypothetical protein ACKOZT_02355 [Cyanobium sp.]
MPPSRSTRPQGRRGPSRQAAGLLNPRRSAMEAAAPIERTLRLQSLWIAYLLAMLFHVELGLMPLFHGISPEIASQVPAQRLGWVYGGMLLYFLVPLACLLRISWAASQPLRHGHWLGWRRLHFWISVVYTLTNVPHLIADIVIPDARGDQVALMAALLLLGLLLNREAWAWWRSDRPEGCQTAAPARQDPLEASPAGASRTSAAPQPARRP